MNRQALAAAFRLATTLPSRVHPRRETREQQAKYSRAYWRQAKRRARKGQA